MAKKKNSLGIMIDFSRNGVMTLPALKDFLKACKKMGYNTFFLYMEDTYEVEGEPYFGYMRSRYSIAEMKEIDEFCTSIGMEAIPCIQTLAHLKTYLKWNQVETDCDDIMMVGEERTYELISNMFKTLSSCFKSKRIHIGMDEAHLLGKGKYLHNNGYRPSSEIINEHLAKICEIAKPYGYEILLWSDMFFRSWNNGDYYTLTEVTDIPEEVINSVPPEVIPVYWDYYKQDAKQYDIMIKSHKQFKSDVWFAGGVWSWQGFAPLNDFSNRSMKPAIEACNENKVKNIFMTMWGDDGMECSHFSQLPALLYVAECAKGNFDEEKIKAKFQRMFGLSYDDFMKTDLPNQIGKKKLMRWESPSKYMLYSDPLLGFLDYTVALGDGATFASHAKELRAVAKKTRKYGYVFSTLAALCDVMEIKYELGLKTRIAYKNGDKAELARLAKEDYTETAKRVKAFHRAFEKQWYIDNKPSGMEVHDGRLGALVHRLDSCKRRILAYVGGELDKLEELDGELLPFGPFDNKEQGEPIIYNCYGRICTSNQFTHFMQ